MSRYFVDDPEVPIPEFDPAVVLSETAPNVIYIRARMDVETNGRVASEMVSYAKDGTATISPGLNDMALLIHNILRWEGPDLGQIACIPLNIRRLDPKDPHIAMVLEEIAKRNKARVAPNPKSSTTIGLRRDGVTAASLAIVGERSRSENGTYTSPLRSALDGHLSKLDD